ncbi:MAG: hypothetical protein R3B99_01680 [Polyangiales bacterium]
MTIAAEPGDLVLAGSASAFSASAVGRVASALQNDSVPPAVLAALLGARGKAGVGAVALALRIR